MIRFAFWKRLLWLQWGDWVGKEHGWVEGDQLDGLARGDGGKDGKRWMGWRKNTKSQKSCKK